MKKVDSYKKGGYSSLQSRAKAAEDLFWKYRKGIMRYYSNIFDNSAKFAKEYD